MADTSRRTTRLRHLLVVWAAVGTLMGASGARAQEIACDQVQSCSLASGTATCNFSFTVVSQEIVHISVGETTAGFTARWRLLVGGLPAASCGSLTTAAGLDCGPLAAGTYQIEVGTTGGTGTADVHLQRLTAAQACNDPVIACDGVQSPTITPATETDLLQFSATSQEIVHISVQETTAGFTVQWRLLSASGTPAADCGSFTTAAGADCGPLPAGTYHIELASAAGTGSAEVHLQRLTATQVCNSPALACDIPQSVTISPAVETDLFTFSAAPQEIIHVSVGETTAGFVIQWRLLSASGTPAAACGNFTTAAGLDCGPLPAGTYQLELASASGTGNADVHMQRLTAAQSCNSPALACDTPQALTISPVVETDLFQFDAASQEIVHIVVGESTGGFTAQWRLLSASGAPASDCGNFTTVFGADCGPLPAGRYQVEVASAGGTGGADIYLQRITVAQACENPAIPCDVPQSTTIISAVETDLFQFAAVEQEIVHISVGETTGGFTAQWRLLSASGAPASACGNFTTAASLDCGPLAAGTYEIELASANTTGSADIHLQRLTASQSCNNPILVCDVPQSPSISPAVETDLFRFTAAEQEIVQITVGETTGGFTAQWRLLSASGGPASDCGNFTTVALADCGPLATGTYQIELASAGGTGSADVHMQRLTASQACDSVSVQCPQTNGTTTPAVENDVFRFVASQTSVQVTVAETSGTFTAEWRLLGTNGAPAPTCGNFTTASVLTCSSLIVGETYQVEVASASGVGTYTVTLAPCVSPPTTTTTTSSTSTSSTPSSSTTSTTRASTSSTTSTTRTTTTSLSSTTSTTIGGTCGTLGVGNATAAAPPGEFCVDIILNNPTRTVRAIQATITDVPDEFQLSRALCTTRTSGFNCSANEVAGNQINVVVLDVGANCIPTGSGAVARVCLTDRLPQCPATNTVQLSVDPASLQIADCNSQACGATLFSGNVACCGLLGDCQADNDFDLFDVLYEIDVVLGRATPTADQRCRCDPTCDGRIDIFDILRSIDALIGRISPPLTCPVPPAQSAEFQAAPVAIDGTVSLSRSGRLRIDNRKSAIRGVELTVVPDGGPVTLEGVRLGRRAKGLTVEYHQASPESPAKILLLSLEGKTIAAGRGTVARLRMKRGGAHGRLYLTEVNVAP